ncbi:hypothetical protein CCE02nite_12850 [Cellulosimicrobium cellulans]|uniref:Uncharacterized protein n=1 Tax=Cellulosimicrobium cellulans TaxID=1710 RepID=A0A4Y4DW71_CELCE|nr:hypothetical protein CCE02nite_12850 [Cellulosimicrobium cellulans]
MGLGLDMPSRRPRGGLRTGETSAHLAEVYGASVSKDTVSDVRIAVRDGLEGPPDAITTVRELKPMHTAVDTEQAQGARSCRSWTTTSRSVGSSAPTAFVVTFEGRISPRAAEERRDPSVGQTRSRLVDQDR